MKFRMYGSDWKDKLKELVDDDNLPNEYGGNRENYCWNLVIRT